MIVSRLKRWQYRVDLHRAGEVVEIRYFDSRTAAGLFAFMSRTLGWQVTLHGERWV